MQPQKREYEAGSGSMANNLYDYCKETGNENLLEEWDREKNPELSPKSVMPGSNKKIWWRCEKGHEWQASVKSRTQGTGCPVCAHRTLKPGENDFAAICPDVARQWHPERNGDLTPDRVSPRTSKKVWWRCDKGHEYQATVASRTTMGTGCPVCAGKVIIPGVNDLASAFPAVAQQWHPEKNGKWTAESVSPFSNRRVWWRCDKGHEWQTSVAHRTVAGSGCPYCSGFRVLAGFNDLETKYPQIAAQWHPTLNDDLTAQMVTPGSHKRVWWQCAYGHSWKAVIYSRTTKRAHGCPVCAGKVSEDWQQRYADAEETNIQEVKENLYGKE